MAPVQFWFEFASTYSYLAALRIEDLAASRGVPFTWRPFLLGPIFARQGWNDSPYNLNPARGAYMWHDIARSCSLLRLPFRKPAVFPKNSVLAARVACLGMGTAWLPGFVRGVFLASFGDDRDIADPALLAEILSGLGYDGPKLVEQAQAEPHRGRLRIETEEAWTAGIIGAPSCVVGDEVFWGNDRLEAAFDWYAAHAEAR